MRARPVCRVAALILFGCLASCSPAPKPASANKKLEPPKGPFGRLRFGGDGSESFISVTSGDTGAIYINDKYWGFIDELNNAGGGMLLPPGEYNVRAETNNFGVVTQTVKIEANKVTVIPLTPKK